ncbi:hypothetical protein M378DRAFT_156492, partial [Amanita muscaria Koide BX008]
IRCQFQPLPTTFRRRSQHVSSFIYGLRPPKSDLTAACTTKYPTKTLDPGVTERYQQEQLLYNNIWSFRKQGFIKTLSSSSSSVSLLSWTCV